MTPGDELPEELADRAAEQLLGALVADRAAVLAALVAAHPHYTTGLQRLAADLGGAERLLDGTYPDPVAETATHIGGHRVIRRLGEGAFGIVFLCAQQQPVVRQVAIKVLRPGAGDERTLRRFAAERQLLAALNHPAITQVFDAGVMPDGRPFFVMEYVDGMAIRSYCEERALSCRDRLRLFVDLCRGVAHAHTRGIVHRDLKPANVLVVDAETGPLCKIIDFGIAKALFASAGDEAPRTDAGRVIGTPGYMSPEQASGRVGAVDERADVFALGVMLYELLTGEMPWAQGAAATDTEPVRPSARVTTSTSVAVSEPPAGRRKLAAELRGELDWITLQALARERDERYPTVTALAADIERHLRGEPVSVGPPSTTYRLRKFVRRNRSLVAISSAAVVVLGIGLVVALAYGRAARESVADAAAMVARLLVRANDERLVEAPQGDSARQALLQDALAAYDHFLEDRPTDPALREGRCRSLLAISQVHWLLGEPTRAGRAADAATSEAEALLAAAPGSVPYRALLGECLRRQGSAFVQVANHEQAQPKFAAAVTHLEACAAAMPTAYGRSHAAALREAAETLPPERAELRLAGLRESLRVLEALRAVEPKIAGLGGDLVDTACELAEQLRFASKFDEAYAILTQAKVDLRDVTSQRLGRKYRVASLQGSVAWDTRQQPGRREEALAHKQSAVEAATAWHGEQPQRLVPQVKLSVALRDLGHVQHFFDDFNASSTSYRRAIERADAMVKQFPDNPARLVGLCAVLVDFALTLSDRFRQSDLDEASACAARATATNDLIPATAQAGRRPRWQLLGMQAVIESARVHGDVDRIWPEVERALPSDPPPLAPGDQDALVGAFSGLARWHLGCGRTDHAAGWLTRARDLIKTNPPVLNKRAVEVGWLEAQLAAAGGDHASAAAAADRILAARSTWYATRRAADCLHLAWRGEGVAARSVGIGYRDRAVGLYERVIRSVVEDVNKDPTDPWYVLPWGFATVRTAELAAAAGNPAKAIELLAAALPRLEAVRAVAHADQWEESIVRAGRELQVRLIGGSAGR